jgi:bifunctional non-homologous end joining protein LigD
MEGDGEVALHAFDLLEVNGFDTRRDVIEDRKRTLAHLLRKMPEAIRFNPHFEREGEAVFEQACRMGFAGIISKRRGSRYRQAAVPTGC